MGRTSFCVAWADLASTSPTRFVYRFERVDADGTVDPASVRSIPGDRVGHAAIELAVGDEELGVARIESTTGLVADSRAWFVRLDASGDVVSGSQLLVGTEHSPQRAIAIAWSPELRMWAVAWQGTTPLGGGGSSN